MSRQATAEYLGQQRRLYAATKSHVKRRAILSSFCEVTGYERKYANKLLSGNRRFRDHPGRGRTYTEDTLELIWAMWLKLGCPCPQYMAARMERNLADFREVCHVPDECAGQILAASASTIARALKGRERVKPGSMRKAYSSPMQSAALSFVEVRSGEEQLAATVPPGDIQVDTVALCGGDMSGNFYWILTLVDRRTQWVEIRLVWNKGAENVFAAINDAVASFPFPVRSFHYDGGREFMNGHLVAYAAQHPEYTYARSRPGKCNDNAHVEQKNGNVVRELFGERRYDNNSEKQHGRILRLCVGWSRYVNLCRFSVQLISRVKRAKAKGYEKTYDMPQTPAERVSAIVGGAVAEKLAAARERVNGIMLREKYLRLLNRINRVQFPGFKALPAAPGLGAARRPFGAVPPPPAGLSAKRQGVSSK